MKKLTAFVLSAMMVLSLAACGSSKAETPAEDTSTPAEDTAPAEDAKLTYAVEAGSAGEEVALANGLQRCIRGLSGQGADGGGSRHG